MVTAAGTAHVPKRKGRIALTSTLSHATLHGVPQLNPLASFEERDIDPTTSDPVLPSTILAPRVPALGSFDGGGSRKGSSASTNGNVNGNGAGGGSGASTPPALASRSGSNGGPSLNPVTIDVTSSSTSLPKASSKLSAGGSSSNGSSSAGTITAAALAVALPGSASSSGAAGFNAAQAAAGAAGGASTAAAGSGDTGESTAGMLEAPQALTITIRRSITLQDLQRALLKALGWLSNLQRLPRLLGLHTSEHHHKHHRRHNHHKHKHGHHHHHHHRRKHQHPMVEALTQITEHFAKELAPRLQELLPLPPPAAFALAAEAAAGRSGEAAATAAAAAAIATSIVLHAEDNDNALTTVDVDADATTASAAASAAATAAATAAAAVTATAYIAEVLHLRRVPPSPSAPAPNIGDVLAAAIAASFAARDGEPAAADAAAAGPQQLLQRLLDKALAADPPDEATSDEEPAATLPQESAMPDVANALPFASRRVSMGSLDSVSLGTIDEVELEELSATLSTAATATTASALTAAGHSTMVSTVAAAAAAAAAMGATAGTSHQHQQQQDEHDPTAHTSSPIPGPLVSPFPPPGDSLLTSISHDSGTTSTNGSMSVANTTDEYETDEQGSDAESDAEEGSSGAFGLATRSWHFDPLAWAAVALGGTALAMGVLLGIEAAAAAAKAAKAAAAAVLSPGGPVQWVQLDSVVGHAPAAVQQWHSLTWADLCNSILERLSWAFQVRVRKGHGYCGGGAARAYGEAGSTGQAQGRGTSDIGAGWCRQIKRL